MLRPIRLQPFFYLLFFSLGIFLSKSVLAGIYLGLSPAQISIQANTAATKTLQTELRLGYETSQHQVELMTMLALRDGELNQLVTEVPSVQSILYRYISPATGSIDMFYILGISKINIISNYPNVAEVNQTFQGISFGFGFEEAFSSYPNLKLIADWLQLYRGEQLKINALSLGIRYEF